MTFAEKYVYEFKKHFNAADKSVNPDAEFFSACGQADALVCAKVMKLEYGVNYSTIFYQFYDDSLVIIARNGNMRWIGAVSLEDKPKLIPINLEN